MQQRLATWIARYPCDPTWEPLEIYDHLPESLMDKVIRPLSFARVLVLDKWLGNTDGRQAIFTRKRKGRRFHAIFIDRGYCLNAAEWTFPDLPLHGIYASNSVYRLVRGWKSFEPALAEAESADIIDVWRCAERVPPEWHGYDFRGWERIVEAVQAPTEHTGLD